MRKYLIITLYASALVPGVLSGLTLNTPSELIREFPRMSRSDQFVQANIAGEDCVIYQGINTVVAESNTPLPDDTNVTVSIDFLLTKGAHSIGIMLTGGVETGESAVALVNTYPNGETPPRLTVFFGEKLDVSLPDNAVTMRNVDLTYNTWHRLTLAYANGEIQAQVSTISGGIGENSTVSLRELTLTDAPIGDWRPNGVALRFYRRSDSAEAEQVAINQVAIKKR